MIVRSSSRSSMIHPRTKLNLVTSFNFAQQSCVYDLNVRSSLSDGMETSLLMSLLDVLVFLLHQL
ncbi:hypothetical protein LINGRAHAP2_LOCUS25739 [Linum grandiflorum]